MIGLYVQLDQYLIEDACDRYLVKYISLKFQKAWKFVSFNVENISK